MAKDAGKKRIYCNICKKIFTPSIETDTIGELAVQHFICPDCGTDYVFSVTNPEVRELIRKYRLIADRTKDQSPLTENEQRAVERLKKVITIKSRRLRDELRAKIQNADDLKYDPKTDPKSEKGL